jgi:hypothetical protein
MKSGNLTLACFAYAIALHVTTSNTAECERLAGLQARAH